jgi:hypothetical protein
MARGRGSTKGASQRGMQRERGELQSDTDCPRRLDGARKLPIPASSAGCPITPIIGPV